MSEPLIIPTEDDPLLSLRKVAQLFSVREYTVRNWIKDGKLKGIQINGHWRVQHSEMVRFANQKYGA